MGGSDFWCNGMHLHCIEAADSPADASWANINCIDDLACDILQTDTHLTIAALAGQCGGGRSIPGARRRLRPGTQRHRAQSALSQHGQFIRVGILDVSAAAARGRAEQAHAIMARRLPLGTPEARSIGLIDDHAGPDAGEISRARRIPCGRIGGSESRFAQSLAEKRRRRASDEQRRSLADYRAEELARMRLNFYGFDPSYHIARHRFVYRTPHAWTPLHLARHRRTAA